MSTRALFVSADAVSEDDYQAFLAVLSASARGRAFLEEHVRRQRQTETAVLLGAIERLKAQIAAQPGRADMSHELDALVESVRSVRSQLAATVTQLAATLDTVQQRLSALISNDVPEPNHEQKLVQPPFALALTPVTAHAVAAAESVEEEEQIKVLKARTIPPPPPFLGEELASPTAEQPTADQLLASQDEHAMPAPGLWNDAMLQIMALSEEERLALFS